MYRNRMCRLITVYSITISALAFVNDEHCFVSSDLISLRKETSANNQKLAVSVCAVFKVIQKCKQRAVKTPLGMPEVCDVTIVIS